MRRTGALVLALTALLPVSPAPAQEAKTAPADDIMKKAVNIPGTNWSVYGPGQTTKKLRDDAVPGGEVLRATVTIAGANAWDAGAISPIQKPIAAGDTILVAMYLRAPALKDGETAAIPYIGANGAAPPYQDVVGTGVSITREWKLYYASGKANRDLPGGSVRVTAHLAAKPQVIDLGPVFVLDFGQNYDPAKLPKN